MVIMKGVNMGVSTVTISIEEFEDLIENKKKIEAIKEVMLKNKKDLHNASKAMICSMIQGNFKEAEEIRENQDNKNINCLIEIDKIVYTRSSEE